MEDSQPGMFRGIKCTSAGTVLLVVLLVGAQSVLSNLVLRTPTLVNGLLGILIIVGGAMLYAGRLRPSDVGLNPNQIARGCTTAIGFWMGVQVFVAGDLLLNPDPIGIHLQWSSPDNCAKVLGRFAEQVLGNALFEETVFRAFLLPQLYLLLFPKLRSKWGSLSVALILSQGMFALMHLPHRQQHGMHGWELLANLSNVGFNGLLYAVLFLATRNLFSVIGVHALFNQPLLLLRGTERWTEAGWYVATHAVIAGALCWKWLRTRWSPKPPPPVPS